MVEVSVHNPNRFRFIESAISGIDYGKTNIVACSLVERVAKLVWWGSGEG